MATLAEIQTFALGNPQFKQRFAASRIQAAWDILVESAPSTQRVAWRNKVLNDISAGLDREYVWALSHSLIQAAGASITDANLNTATKSFVDVWAAYDAANP